jgi:hypothetical protein
LSRLLALDVSMEWHDAVAIVSQLAEQAAGDKRRPGFGAVPAIGAIGLEPEGRLQLQLDPNGSEPIPTGVGRVLQALLKDRPLPANLRLLAWRATAQTGAAMTLDEITAELARWERPGRIEKLKDLYERARSAGPAPLQAAALQPHEVPSDIVEPPTTPEPSMRSVMATGSRRHIAVITAAAIVVCVAVAAGTIAFRRMSSGLSQDPRTVAAAPESASSPAVAADIDVPNPTASRRPNRRVRPPEPRPVPGIERSAGGVHNPQRTAPPDASPKATVGRSSSTSPLNEVSAGVTGSAAVSQPSVATIPDSHLYKSGDAGVTEPVLVKPYLPLRPHADIPDSALGVLEVVVDARGQVESVHLKSPANRYREKWWLFTAKDWRFEPASKNGRPVKFLKRILLTDLNITEPQ